MLGNALTIEQYDCCCAITLRSKLIARRALVIPNTDIRNAT